MTYIQFEIIFLTVIGSSPSGSITVTVLLPQVIIWNEKRSSLFQTQIVNKYIHYTRLKLIQNKYSNNSIT